MRLYKQHIDIVQRLCQNLERHTGAPVTINFQVAPPMAYSDVAFSFVTISKDGCWADDEFITADGEIDTDARK